jgi:colanic acid biosynthesis glycosyl transferase WcaI
MRVIVWGINYAPEKTGIAPFNTGLCDFLRGQGHAVEMVTSFAYYPTWRKGPEAKGRLWHAEILAEVRVHRCWHYVPARVTTLRRIAHELSFGLMSFVRVLVLARPDVYVIVSPPLLLGPLAALIGALKRRPYVFHVQDLQPDAAVGLGMVRPGPITRLLYRIEARSYRHAARVSGISEGMVAAFARKGVPAAKRVLFPNWLPPGAAGPRGSGDAAAEAAGFRRKFGLPAGAFLACYSGNLGRKQGLEGVVEAAAVLAERRGTGGSEVFILIIGDGAMRADLTANIAARSLTNVRLLPLLADADYRAMLAAVDVSLISQAPGTGQFFFPSKLLSVLAAGCPVVSVADADSELARAVADGGFGVNCPPADAAALAATLAALAGEPERVQALRAKTRWVERYAAERVLPAFVEQLRAVTSDG